ncbi:histidinol-phosphate transaminase [Arthrobacter crystallopoietes]|uniref:histidinol-phosphate transaminase n=1 Tax=Crystallibacter crystallopoietes TaxID=37928 RepID=UPI001ABDAAC0|nr:histidinol-phosphate transaminase [Arthrobacter crystallopoietes]QTG81683.1 histidinol-phosphate transaminase [Arthrobacter crystallopoietes]
MSTNTASPLPPLEPPAPRGTNRGTTGPSPRPGIAMLPGYSRSAGKASVRWIASSNELPVPPSRAVQDAVAAAAADANRYPSLAGDNLVAAVAGRLGLEPGQVVAGAGSLALLQLLLTTYTGSGDEVIYAWRSYEAYPILVGVTGAAAVEVPLTSATRHDLNSMAAAITTATRAVIVCSPNNPTGTTIDHEELMDFLNRVPAQVLVILDEAYREFSLTEHDSTHLLKKYANLAVLRTFSKAYGLAGLRAGYLAASQDIAANLRRAAPPFPLSRVAEAAAIAAWNEPDATAQTISRIVDERRYLSAQLRSRGIEVPESGGNFVWIPAGDRALELEAACLAQSVSVRAFDREGVRITLGEHGATTAVLAAVDSMGAAVHTTSGTLCTLT